jgi:uncharacterized paraquat-inducible protein A
MPFRVACPRCGDSVHLPDNFAGNSILCPKCSQGFEPVPMKHRRFSLNAIVVVILVLLALAIVVDLVAIQFLGRNANTAFNTVGRSIGPFPGKTARQASKPDGKPPADTGKE